MENKFRYDHLTQIVRNVVEPLIQAERNLSIAEYDDCIARINDILRQIAIINQTLKSHQNQINSLDRRVDTLESAITNLEGEISSVSSAVSSITSICVGTIITWPTGNNPSDYKSGSLYNWLDCDGSTFSQSSYPDLFRILGGSKLPNYKGMFLRGYGSQNSGGTTYTSGSMMRTQGDAMRKMEGHVSLAGMVYVDSRSGVFERAASSTGHWAGSGGGSLQCDDFIFDSSCVVPTANEIRPVNVAVRYLIRSLP